MDIGACDPQLSEFRKMQQEEDVPWPSVDQSLNEDRSGRVAGASEEDMKILEADLRLRLHEWGPLLTAGQRLLVWERPLPSLLTAAALHGTFWLFSYLSLRPVFLLSLFLLCLLGVQHWKPWLLSHFKVPPRGEPSGDSEGLGVVGGGGHHRLLTVPELCHYLAESWFTSHQYIQEVLLYKKHNPGKFCAAVCSGCAVLTVLGYYVPGIMISYIILLSVLLWPLVVYRELIQRMYTALEPVLMKLEYSMKGEAMPRSHKKRQVKKEPDEGEEIVAETDSESEIELPGFSPELDVRITALALSITDSELSDEEASILESGGFSVSRATTPQLTDVSEDLDQPSTATEEPANSPPWVHEKSLQKEEARSLPSQPLALNQEELVPSLTSPLHFVNTHFNGKGQPPGLESELHPLSEEMANRTISTTLQSPITPLPALGLTAPETQEPGGDGEDFELLEQGELDLMREEFKEAERFLSTTSSSSTPASTESGLEKPSS
ncbi:reticulophagy regulator 2 [Spea bombifrons]|uniref:reticulophagy regulator 2 n=1 Tax=Spea bombifrons TaxID=233779 RepID=UPI00234B8ABA|nr:reticulophagy regulator 2 [Spea bombifrons]